MAQTTSGWFSRLKGRAKSGLAGVGAAALSATALGFVVARRRVEASAPCLAAPAAPLRSL